MEKNNTKAIILVVGRSEYYQKYYELIYDLKDLPYDWFIVDVLGQGQSQRYLKDSQKMYIENYTKHIRSFKN